MVDSGAVVWIMGSLMTTSAPNPRTRSVASKRPLTAIVKPTDRCNLACKYCYVSPSAKKGVMTGETLLNAMTQVATVADGRSVQFVWHGGEPLLSGLEFLEEVARISEKLRAEGHSISNSIQTNGTLVTDELLDFIERQNDFPLGLSLDGPRAVNDRSRVYPGGRSCFDAVISAVRKIRDRATEKPGSRLGGGVIVVVSQLNISDLPEIYRFFRDERVGIKVNAVVVSEGPQAKLLAVSPVEYAHAMNSLFDTWIEDPDTINVDPFDLMMGNLVTGSGRGCNHSVSCVGNFVSIGPQGDIYPCGRFDGDAEFWLGNVNQPGGLEAALKTSCFVKLEGRSGALLGGCSTCRYLRICNAGCMHNALTVGNVMEKDFFCAAYKLMYAHIENYLLQELDYIKKTYAKDGAN